MASRDEDLQSYITKTRCVGVHVHVHVCLGEGEVTHVDTLHL